MPACTWTGDDHRVGKTAVDRVIGRVVERDVAQWCAMLDMHVRPDLGACSKYLAVAKRAIGPPLDDALIGDRRAGVDVRADERRSGHGGDTDRAEDVIA